MKPYVLVQLSAVKGSSGQFSPVMFSPFHHDVAVGNAREGDDMDAATRRRFA